MIRLEYFEEKDFSQLIKWISDETLLTHWSGNLFKFPLTARSLAWYLEETNDLLSSDAFVYKAIDGETGNVVGHISLGGISRKNRSARISRVLVGERCERNKSVCQGMINAILKIGFEDINLHRISLGVYDTNVAAIKCYEKAGFISEGINRDVLRYNNEWWSMVEMSMLEPEWRAKNLLPANYNTII